MKLQVLNRLFVVFLLQTLVGLSVTEHGFVPLISGQVAAAQPTYDIAFPNLAFARPVDLQHSGDGTNRLFVLEQNTGLVRVFDNDPSVTESFVYLDVSDRFSAGGDEEGLLGLAFHPDFANNGYLFVYYSAASPRRSVVQRFRVDSLLQRPVDRNTGKIIMEVAQPNSNHNGGQIRFGPDGYLYIGLGDGGGGGDPDETGQDRKELLGSILRIDIDATSDTLDYGIPPDNPFVADTTGFKKEIFAWGLRNPWKFSFDVDGNLWVGDVGQGTLEEVDLVVSGGNYGWNTMEGDICFDPRTGCDQTGLELPVHVYGRTLGRSITGGFRYRGARVPGWTGSYIFGDYVSGRIWSLPYDNGTVGEAEELFDTSLGIASFGEDESGELYLCAFDGRIYHFSSESVDTENTDEAEDGVSVSVFPNPATESVTFSVDFDGTGHILLRVFDVLGRSVYSAEFADDRRAIVWDILASQREISSGIYFFRLEGGNQTHVKTGSFLINR